MKKENQAIKTSELENQSKLKSTKTKNKQDAK